MASGGTFKVLICDPIGLRRGDDGEPDISDVKCYIENMGGAFHALGEAEAGFLTPDKIHFFYLPHLSNANEILKITENGEYDAVIAAATFLPENALFKLGGVRIGAGTSNMRCHCWGGGEGVGGVAPLMNTPSFNSRATAQMVMKALLRFLPDLPLSQLHDLSVGGHFDTGKNLADFPTEKLEGKTFAILGYGNIGREVALLARAFGMIVKIHARSKHRAWIESEGFTFADTPQGAAHDAHVLSVHVGLGARDGATGKFANAAFVGADVLRVMQPGATVINFDRGECVDASALDAAMAKGDVRFAAIDADIFRNESAEPSGPLVPYLPLAQKYGHRVLLLPHAAADTCHTSRVDGAKQAVTQIMECLTHRRVTNLKGDLPAGFTDAGAKTVKGVGKVLPSAILNVLSEDVVLKQVLAELQTMTTAWAALQSLPPEQRKSAIVQDAPRLINAINRHATLIKELGLHGPF